VKLAVQFLKTGANSKRYANAASNVFFFMYVTNLGALNTDVKIIEAGVEGVSHLFAEASRMMISEADFLATIILIGFSNEISESLKNVCTFIGSFLII
jgi:hypothetical protein